MPPLLRAPSVPLGISEIAEEFKRLDHARRSRGLSLGEAGRYHALVERLSDALDAGARHRRVDTRQFLRVPFRMTLTLRRRARRHRCDVQRLRRRRLRHHHRGALRPRRRRLARRRRLDGVRHELHGRAQVVWTRLPTVEVPAGYGLKFCIDARQERDQNRSSILSGARPLPRPGDRTVTVACRLGGACYLTVMRKQLSWWRKASFVLVSGGFMAAGAVMHAGLRERQRRQGVVAEAGRAGRGPGQDRRRHHHRRGIPGAHQPAVALRARPLHLDGAQEGVPRQPGALRGAGQRGRAPRPRQGSRGRPHHEAGDDPEAAQGRVRQAAHGGHHRRRVQEVLRRAPRRVQQARGSARQLDPGQGLSPRPRRCMADSRIKGVDNQGFRNLVAEYSQDQATKERGGDLRYFDAKTKDVPKELVDGAFKLQNIGDTSEPIKTAAGRGHPQADRPAQGAGAHVRRSEAADPQQALPRQAPGLDGVVRQEPARQGERQRSTSPSSPRCRSRAPAGQYPGPGVPPPGPGQFHPGAPGTPQATPAQPGNPAGAQGISLPPAGSPKAARAAPSNA